MGAACCTLDPSHIGQDAKLEEQLLYARTHPVDLREFGPARPEMDIACDQAILRPMRSPIQGEEKILSAQMIPRCNSYYTTAVNPPPATPRCASFLEVAQPQTSPSEAASTRLPSLPENEVHCAPEPCKWDPVFLDLMLTHLDKAEDLSYRAAFDNLTGDTLDSVPLNSRDLRDFLLEHTVLVAEDLDAALRSAASDEGCLELDGFLELIRDNCVETSSCELWFQQALLSGQSPEKDLTPESCEACLRHFLEHEAQRLPESAVEQKQLERICTSVLKGAGERVSLEEWTSYCKQVARTITLARYVGESCSGY